MVSSETNVEATQEISVAAPMTLEEFLEND